MRVALTVGWLALASTALAQKPPPLGVPWAPMPFGKPLPLNEPAAPAAAEDERVVLPRPGQRAFATGSGFVVASGKILTNRHVVAPCASIVVRDPGGARVPARVDAADPARDLALLDVALSALPALTFRASPPIRRGEFVVAYGFPLSGLLSSGPTLTLGNVNALAGLRDNPANLQISAAVQPGSSGGPLFDTDGHVIGVVVAKLNAARVAQLTGGDIPQNVNFAVKGAEAVAFLQAHGVQPRLAASTGPERRPDAIDAIAGPSTVLLQCFR